MISAVAITTGGLVDSRVFIAAIKAGISSFKILFLISGGEDSMRRMIDFCIRSLAFCGGAANQRYVSDALTVIFFPGVSVSSFPVKCSTIVLSGGIVKSTRPAKSLIIPGWNPLLVTMSQPYCFCAENISHPSLSSAQTLSSTRVRGGHPFGTLCPALFFNSSPTCSTPSLTSALVNFIFTAFLSMSAFLPPGMRWLTRLRLSRYR